MLSQSTLLFWGGFHAVVVIAIYIDLFLLNRKNTNNNMTLNLLTVGMWMAAGLGFGGVVWYSNGYEGAMQYWTCYMLEQSLSVDNLFVFLIIFQYFRVHGEEQRRVLVWGILAAIILYGVFIAAGVTLVHYFSWILYPMGALLVYTGFKLLKSGDEDGVDPSTNPVLKLCRRLLPVSDKYDGTRFTTRVNGKFAFTPLFVVLVVINTTDIMFATDSIPAMLGVSQDLFIVYTACIAAVCCLRALYFALAGLFDVLHLLKYGLAIVLSFIGVKMLAEWPIEHYTHISKQMMTLISLGVVAGTLGGSVILSLVFKKKDEGEDPVDAIPAN